MYGYLTVVRATFGDGTLTKRAVTAGIGVTGTADLVVAPGLVSGVGWLFWLRAGCRTRSRRDKCGINYLLRLTAKIAYST